MVIVAVEIAIVVTAFTKKGKVEDFIDKRLDEMLHKSKNDPALFKSWDLMQREVNGIGNDIETKVVIINVFCFVVEMLRCSWSFGMANYFRIHSSSMLPKGY